MSVFELPGLFSSWFFIFFKGGKGAENWFLAGDFTISSSASMHALLGCIIDKRRNALWDMVRSFFIAVLLGFFTVASAQLPPKIMADKHLIHAEQLYAAKDYAEAFNVMEKIIALQKEHNLTLPDEFHFKYAQVALAADSTRIALESVTRYLSATGDEGQFYKEALALMLKAEEHDVMSEEDFYNEVIKAEGTCEGLPVGSSCWMELTNHPECYVWNGHLSEGETVTWTGKCSGHLPEGRGTLIWRDITKNVYGRMRETTEEGSFQNGRRHGEWVLRWVSGSSVKGPYVNGEKHGKWVDRPNYIYFDSDFERRFVGEGSYVEDEEQGQWIYRHSNGDIIKI